MIEAGCQTHVPATIIKQVEDWKLCTLGMNGFVIFYIGHFERRNTFLLINFTNRIEPSPE